MNAAADTVDGLASDLCPLHGRRSSQEVRMQLFVVHFITIAAFCHILNLRKERILGSKLALYLLLPSTFLLAHVLASILLAAGALTWLLFNRTGRLAESLKRAPWLFLGSAPVSEDANEAGGGGGEHLLKMGGRYLLTCALLGTVQLHSRIVHETAETRCCHMDRSTYT
jgi:hypothetical protein